MRAHRLLVAVYSVGLVACGSPVGQPAVPGSPTNQAVLDTEFDQLADFGAATFSDPTTIDNSWLPLTPGTQFVYEGVTLEGGEEIPHRYILTVTDLTKIVAGVETVVVWDQDLTADVLNEAEIALFAQADDGTVWHFGQYPEEYDAGSVVATPGWVAGYEGAKPGITIKANPDLGGASYSQGWGPFVNWTDRARATEIVAERCTPLDCFADVLITEEFAKEEPNAIQLKYYATGVGNIGTSWTGDDPTRETLDLVQQRALNPAELVEARKAALALEANAYANIPAAYGETEPMS